jgi:hypothetical protein
MAWSNTTKNSSSFTNDSKNASVYVNGSKNSSSYSNGSKNATTFTDESKVLNTYELLTNITLVEVKNAMENHNKVLEKLISKLG